MAKNEKMDKAAILAALEANHTRGGSRLKDRSFTIKKDWTAEELGAVSLAPQARLCVAVILDHDEDTISEQGLFNAFAANEALFTGSKQGAWKVFSYYRKKIEDAGFLKLIA